MASTDHYDIAILGSGFGASLLAAILCKSGLKVCLVDQGAHPRFSIGESSTPAADMLLQDLCQTYRLDELAPLCRFGTWRKAYPHIRCGCKRGFSYIWHGEEGGYRPTPNHAHEMLVAASSSREVADIQWYRADVDLLFCQYAIKSGVSYFPMSNVERILHQDNFSWKIRLNANGQQHAVTSRFLIDATGPRGLLLRHLNVPEITHEMCTNTSTIYSHFENVPLVADWLSRRGTDQSEFPYPVDDAAVHHVFQDGWLWQLRFEGGPTSLGFVFRHPSESADFQRSAQESWWNLLIEKPILQEIIGGSSLSVTPGKFYQTNRLQRLFQQAAGKDWAALPFTAGFIDPLHSTGIAHTLLGVRRLAAVLLRSRQQAWEFGLEKYSEKVVSELRHVDRLVSVCYENLGNFSRFSAGSMLYFAAATTFEKKFHLGSDDFLCASDPAFREVLQKVSDLAKPAVSCDQTETFVRMVEASISPFNHVGLFHPRHSNMYYYTAAEK